MADSMTLQRLSLRQLIWACLGVMAAAFVVVSAAAVAGQVGVARAVEQLSNEVVPIQGEVDVLWRAFTDQEAAHPRRYPGVHTGRYRRAAPQPEAVCSSPQWPPGRQRPPRSRY